MYVYYVLIPETLSAHPLFLMSVNIALALTTVTTADLLPPEMGLVPSAARPLAPARADIAARAAATQHAPCGLAEGFHPVRCRLWIPQRAARPPHHCVDVTRTYRGWLAQLQHALGIASQCFGGPTIWLVEGVPVRPATGTYYSQIFN